MAHLLDLVDKFIGDILHGNVFTDIDTFQPRLPQRPAGADIGIPDASLRPLNVQGVKAHPHAGSPIIPPPQHSPPPQPPGPPHVPGAGEPIVPGPPHIPGSPIPAVPGPPHIPGVVEPVALGPDKIPGEPFPAVPGAPLIDQRPVNADAHNPNVDPRLLNFNDANPHPHAGLAGPGGEHNAKTHVIPTEPNALHDNTGAFLTPSQVAGMLAKQTPGGKRGEIYAGSKFKPGGQELHPDVGEQIAQVSTPLDPVIPRDEIYSKSASGNRVGGPLSDLLAFHESRTHPHPGTVIPTAPPALNAESPGYVNNSGKHPAEHGKIGEPAPSRDEIYQNSHPKDDTIKAPADPLAGVPPGHSHTGPESQIPNPETRHLPATQGNTLFTHYRPDGYSPSQHGSTPDSLTPENYEAGTTGLRNWENIEGPKREQLYSKTPNFVPPIPPDVISQKDITTDLAQAATKFPANVPPEFTKDPAEAYDPGRRNDIYTLAEGDQLRSNVAGTPLSRPTVGDQLAAQGQRPPTLNFQGSDTGDVPTDFAATANPDRPLVLERPFGADAPLGGSRDDLASQHHALRTGPNASELGSYNNLLSTVHPHGLIDKVATSDGHRSGQVYGESYTAVQGAGGEILKYLDVIAAAKWFENVRKEIGAVIPAITVNSQQDDRNELAKSTEGIVKSVIWPVSQLLLTAFNPTDTAGYGELNAIWNPLSFAGSIIPLLRSTPLTHITLGAAAAGVGFSGYIQNVMDSVSDSPAGIPGGDGERLLQMRTGAYQKSLDGTTLAQLNLGDTGFKGDLTHVGIGPHPSIEATDLLGALKSLGSDLLGTSKKLSIQDQVDTDAAAELGIHGNLYNSDRPYNQQNAILPLDQYDFEADANAGTTPDPDPMSVRFADMFMTKGFPGQAGMFPGQTPSLLAGPPIGAYTYVANPVPGSPGFANLTDAPGLNAGNTDVGFSPEDYEKGVLAEVIAEDAIYMPFMFQDLRDTTDTFLYFRAFLKGGISETFTPDWQTERYYGRVDQIPIYQGTIRSVSLTFDVVAWKPADLPTMWRKLEKLQSMVYPFYNSAGFLNAGPIVRMRIGDLFASSLTEKGGRGLPGYITSMDWSYDDGIWNIATDFKVPRKVSVSIGFTVLHDGNPGTYHETGPVTFPDNAALPSEVGADGLIFGAGKFTREAGATENVLNVSRAEIRKIFETVKSSGG